MDDIGNYVASVLRTAVPGAWGAVLAAAASFLPGPIGEFLDSPPVAMVVTLAVILAWYAVWRKVEPYLPPNVTRLVLGANSTPKYVWPEPGGKHAANDDLQIKRQVE